MAQSQGRCPARSALQGLVQGGHGQRILAELKGGAPLFVPAVRLPGVQSAAALLGAQGGRPLPLAGQAVPEQVVPMGPAGIDRQGALQRSEGVAIAGQSHQGLADAVEKMGRFG